MAKKILKGLGKVAKFAAGPILGGFAGGPIGALAGGLAGKSLFGKKKKAAPATLGASTTPFGLPALDPADPAFKKRRKPVASPTILGSTTGAGLADRLGG